MLGKSDRYQPTFDHLRRTFSRMGFLILICAVVLGAAVELARAQENDSDSGAMSDYTKGVFLLESGSPRSAIPHLERAWEKSEHDETVGQKLAEGYFRIGDIHSSDRILEEIISKNENNQEALVLRAKVRYVQGDRERAVEYLEQVKSFSQTTFEIEHMLGKLNLELGRDEEALEAYGEAIHIDPNYPSLQYRYGLLLRKFGKSDEAEAALETALKLEPRLTDAAVELADLYMMEGRSDEAQVILEQSLEHDPDAYEALFMLANLHVESGRMDQAIQLLEGQSQRSGLPRNGMLLLARIYYEAKDYEESLALFKSLFDSDDQSSELARVIAEVYLKVGKLGEAREYFERAIELGPEDYRNHLALFFAASPRVGVEADAAIELPEERLDQLISDAAVRVTAEDFDGLYLVGISYQGIDELELAREYLERALELRPDSDRVLLNLAGVFEKMNRYEDAEKNLVALHELRPDDPTVCNFYGYLLSLMNKELPKAEELVQSALQHEPDNGYYVDSLGWIYYMMGDYNKAVIELERAVSLVPDDPIILEHLGDAYQALKRYRDALSVYEKSRDLQDDKKEILDKIEATRFRLGN